MLSEENFRGIGSELIRVTRAYFTCERCGAGFFPPGPGEEDSGRLE